MVSRSRGNPVGEGRRGRPRHFEPAGGEICACAGGCGDEAEGSDSAILAFGQDHVKLRGAWRYLYRSVDRDGQTLDFMLSEHRDEAAALRFLAQNVSLGRLKAGMKIQ